MVFSGKIILASGSPRRRELLSEAGYRFDVVVPDASVECGVCSDEGPAGLVASLALRKAADVIQRGTQGIIVAADTVAECDGAILGKPADRDDARQMLTRLSGRPHRVYTGVCVWPQPDGSPAVKVAVTTLTMDSLAPDALEAYLDSGAWEGKAGALGYQDRLGWVHVVDGSESNVVGLPMELLAKMLKAVSADD